MSKRRRRQRPAKKSPPGRHLHAVPEPDAPPPPPGLFGDIASALEDPEPLSFLGLASTLVSALDPRSVDPLDIADDGPDAATFVETLIGHDSRETTALLHALAELLPDNHLAQRARREARRRAHHLRDWLTSLDDAEPGPASATMDVLGDGENVVVTIRLAGGEPLTAIVYVDHNLGSVAKDGFVIPVDADAYRASFFAHNDDPGVAFIVDLEPAEARARMEQAIEIGALMVPRLESDTWPAFRPLVEWIVRRLPSGGGGFVRPEVTDQELDGIAEAFLGSPHASDLTGPDDAEIAADLLRFATDDAGGDPLRWSPVSIELLLVDWYPRRISTDSRYQRRVPTVLRALVPYAHEHNDIPPHLTDQTLDAIDRWEPVYLDLAIGGETAEPLDWAELTATFAQYRRDHAIRAVGGVDALLELDDTPLPDEPFAWNGIPDDVRPRVSTVLKLLDACAQELFDVEMRTAFRRVLARTAATEPQVFRRRSKDSTAAAAVAWAVATVNDQLSAAAGGLTATALLAHFGVTGSVSQRARPFLRSFGQSEHDVYAGLTFGTPEVLTSQRRAALVQIRDTD